MSTQKKTVPVRKSVSSSQKADGNFWLAALVMVVLTFLAYQPAIRGGFIWDDGDMIFENELVKGGLGDIWFSTKFYDYYPLTLTSLWVEWRLFGMAPMGYHIINVALHALTAVFFWRALRRLPMPGAWLAGMLFALHPVNVESAAWIAERKNTLPMVFYALSLLWFLRSEEAREQGMDSGKKFYGLAIGAFALALLAKTSVVMFPFVLLGCAWWRRGTIGRTDLLRSAPFFGLSLLLGLVTVWVQYNRAIGTDVVQTAGFAEKLARAGWATWFYLYKAVLPLNLSFVYPRWTVDAGSALSYLPGVAYFVVMGICWRFRQSWGRPLLFALSYFVVTLFPVLGFFNIYFQKYSYVADHWQYTSIIGLIALVAGLVGRGAEKQPFWKAVGVLLIAGAFAGTWQQSRIYHSEETVWRDTVRKNPQAAIAHQGLGVLTMNKAQAAWEQGNKPAGDALQTEATDHFRAAIAANPKHESAHYSLGSSLAQQGQFEEALKHFRQAVEAKPNYDPALNAGAWIMATSQNPSLRNGPDAVAYAELAVKLTEEKNVSYLETLAAAYAENRDFPKAQAAAAKAVAVAEAEGDAETAGGLKEQIRLYERGRPLRID